MQPVRQPSNGWPAMAILLGFVVHFGVPLAKKASGQEPIPTPPGVPAPSGVVDGGFISADELLRQADARHPLTAEGWIVRVPATNNGGFAVDPGRARDEYEYLSRLRQYDSQIRMAQAEIYSWRRRLSVYRYFNKTGALMVTYENAMLSLINAEEQLRNLRYERMLLMRQYQLRPKHLVVEPQAEERVVGVSY